MLAASLCLVLALDTAMSYSRSGALQVVGYDIADCALEYVMHRFADDSDITLRQRWCQGLPLSSRTFSLIGLDRRMTNRAG